ncbi:hypothetical protein SRB5_32270 [Streptomyces sp. RB5]|uniref:Uncharacterized protein n=1 Tax=Streptomyces smaragdinus TaxID=2585196 RepID=A0A7K0CHY8_9ACTN|nr:hypothetical protein [Streptomyces smaragdinus]MQY13087.1 hypothetical protein [Streptomyces smaragdinus]
MLEGVLIAESLRVGAVLDEVPLRVGKIARVEVGGVGDGQPRQWTLVHFVADERDAERLAGQLAGAVSPEGGWYVNYNTGAEAFVVFAGHVVRYPRGDAAGREEAKAYARGVGIPEGQLDWRD